MVGTFNCDTGALKNLINETQNEKEPFHRQTISSWEEFGVFNCLEQHVPIYEFKSDAILV